MLKNILGIIGLALIIGLVVLGEHRLLTIGDGLDKDEHRKVIL